MTKIEGARGPLVELCSIRWLNDHRIGWFGSFRFLPRKVDISKKNTWKWESIQQLFKGYINDLGYYPTVIHTITLMIWKPCESRKAIQQWWECQAAYRGCVQSSPRNSGLPCAEMLRSPYSDWSLERIGWSDMSMEQSTDDVPVNKHRISWNPSPNVFEVFVQLSVCSGSFRKTTNHQPSQIPLTRSPQTTCGAERSYHPVVADSLGFDTCVSVLIWDWPGVCFLLFR